ncbi:MlaD family protein [Mycobacteroides abscessus]|uniref:MlaD family protein n=1 Tax=Mycobacteroides abscessus TaxID=36809 RepID=UPI0009C8536E|nr:MCE family protein [Mycobacteroides abscessus]SLG92404.1 Putative Mce family protein [Mycobacteroides abscessus subsp. massiliense]
MPGSGDEVLNRRDSHHDLDGAVFSRRQLLVRGGAALALVAVMTAGLLIKSTGVLDRYVNVIADLHNVGDGLPPRSDVKYRGVLVGAVDEVTPSAGTQPNRVRVRLKPMYARSIPATVTARVVPSNVFAVSALQLVDHGPGAPIREGGHIAEDTRLPTVLFQTTVNKLRQILTAAGRGREDNTVGILAAVGAATNHRRAELLTSAAQLDRMLDQLNAIVATDQGPSTVSALVQAAHGLSQTAPDLVDALHQAVRPMQTLAEKRDQLRTFIGAGVQTTGTTVRSLHNHTDQLIQITTDLTPVLGVLADNAQHFVPITRRITRFSDTFFREVWDPELATAKGRVNLSFTPSYTYTRADCPRYGELKGPSCFTAPQIAVRPDLPEVLLPQNYQPPANLAPPPGTVLGDNGNLIAVGPPLVNPNPDLRAPTPPVPPWLTPAPPVPGSADPGQILTAPASFGGNVGPVGSTQERGQLGQILGQPATSADQLVLGPLARGTVVTRAADPHEEGGAR